MTFTQILGDVFYTLIGLVFVAVGVKALRDADCRKKATTAIFWFVLAFTFIGGNWLPKWITGVCVVILAVLTGSKGVVQSKSNVPDPKEVRAHANKLGYNIFIPALCLALFAVAFATLGDKVAALKWMTSNNAIGLSGICALITVLLLVKCSPKYAVIDGTRLMDNVGTIGILPQLLSALGALFTAAGVGTVIASGVSAIIPEGNHFMASLIYCVAMALFTIIMGNGFAAFSVITVGIGIPFLIMQGANPVVVGALGLTAGYCGTLCTPMAANFNIMPAALLEVRNKYAIIKSQVPVAIFMLIVHVLLMYFFAF